MIGSAYRVRIARHHPSQLLSPFELPRVSFCSRPDIKNVRRTVQPHQASLSPTGTEKSLDAPRVYRALRKVGSFRLNENAQLTSPPWRSDHTTGDGVAIHCREQ